MCASEQKPLIFDLKLKSRLIPRSPMIGLEVVIIGTSLTTAKTASLLSGGTRIRSVYLYVYLSWSVSERASICTGRESDWLHVIAT